MPNGGRQGDNPLSWFMEDLCRGAKTYLGEPIDSLACEIYRVSKHENAAGISLNDDKDKIDPIALETRLRETLASEKEKRKQRVNDWANSDTSGVQYSAPQEIADPVKETVRYAMKYCADCVKEDAGDSRQIDELMSALNDIRVYYSEKITNWEVRSLNIAKHLLRGFDSQHWEGAPDFVEILESAVKKREKL